MAKKTDPMIYVREINSLAKKVKEVDEGLPFALRSLIRDEGRQVWWRVEKQVTMLTIDKAFADLHDGEPVDWRRLFEDRGLDPDMPYPDEDLD